MNAAWIEELRHIIGDERRILTSDHELLCYAYDASFGVYRPDIVVRPQSATEIATIVQLANREKFAVTPRGLATSLSGGPLPVQGGIVLDLSHMNE
mgnify:CR=1 FL=1